MTRLDPIIAVKNVEASSKWYQALFGCKSMHGGSQFDVLKTDDDEVLICLHIWGEHDHPTMIDERITPGNGLILYFRVKDIAQIRLNAEKLAWAVEENIHVNPNSRKREFSLRDPDGYYLIISEFHKYEG